MDSFFGVWDIDAHAPTRSSLGGEFTNVNGVATQGVAILPPQTDRHRSRRRPPGTPTVTDDAAPPRSR